MLVISRKTSESILIGDNIEVIISEISADRVKLAIRAPKEIPVLRNELVLVAKQNEEASAVSQSFAIQKLKELLK